MKLYYARWPKPIPTPEEPAPVLQTHTLAFAADKYDLFDLLDEGGSPYEAKILLVPSDNAARFALDFIIDDEDGLVDVDGDDYCSLGELLEDLSELPDDKLIDGREFFPPFEEIVDAFAGKVSVAGKGSA